MIPNMEATYRDANGNPCLVPSVVAYIDILGYVQYIKENNGQQELIRLRSALDEAYRELKLYSDENQSYTPKIFVRTFTDNLVIGIPMPKWQFGDFPFAINSIVSYIGFLQAQLAIGGYLIRGAISVGDFYVDEDIVFGEALIEAYEAEKSLAVFPRVILGKSVIEAFKKNQNRGYITDLLLDSDNQVFVDFLDATVMIAYPDDRPFTEFLEGHKKCVEEKLNVFSDKPYIRAKYEWAANYHNSFCDRYQDVIERDFRIPAETLMRPIIKWTLPENFMP